MNTIKHHRKQTMTTPIQLICHYRKLKGSQLP
jgi:hypothetical protein